MKIEHIAIWTKDLERVKSFYLRSSRIGTTFYKREKCQTAITLR